MSGHSHWASIKHKKGAEDEKRGKIFSKFARLISIAAREKGGNPETNTELRAVIEKAKSLNMPQENVIRAIKRGTGEIEGAMIESLLLEGFGPSGTAVLITVVTDNKNRTLSDVRQILEKSGGKLASGGVLWMFEKRGCIVIDTREQKESGGELQAAAKIGKEELELLAIESGAEDIKWRDDTLEVYTKPEDLDKVKKVLENKNVKIESSSLDWVPKEEVKIEDKEARQKIEKLFETLDDHDDVQEIYSNLAA